MSVGYNLRCRWARNNVRAKSLAPLPARGRSSRQKVITGVAPKSSLSTIHRVANDSRGQLLRLRRLRHSWNKPTSNTSTSMTPVTHRKTSVASRHSAGLAPCQQCCLWSRKSRYVRRLRRYTRQSQLWTMLASLLFESFPLWSDR